MIWRRTFMEPIYSMTTLMKNPSKVKTSAQRQLVRITEQGGEGYIFSSEKAFEDRIAKERAEAAYEARLLEAVGRGLSDIENNRFYTSIDAAMLNLALRE